MAWKEGLVTLALSFEGLQFGGHIDGAVAVVANIERYDADGVAGNQELVLLLVVEHEGEDATQVLEEVDALFAIEGKDDLTVAARLELILSGITAANLLMVIYLAVDSQHLLPVGREQRLSA